MAIDTDIPCPLPQSYSSLDTYMDKPSIGSNSSKNYVQGVLVCRGSPKSIPYT